MRSTDDLRDIEPSQELRSTDDVMTDAEFAEFFDMEEAEESSDDPVQVCEGEWRRDAPGKWRFWRDPAMATDA